jgi:hypothetical protein
VVKEARVPISKFSAIAVNILTTILPCLGFIWGMATEIKLMELRIEYLEKFSITSGNDRTQMHEMLNAIDKRAGQAADRVEACKELLNQHMSREEK